MTKKMTIRKLIGKAKEKSRAVITGVMTALFLLCSNTTTVFASDIAGSQIAKGTEKLIQDVTTWLMVLAPVAAGLLIIYFCIRRSAADEMDQSVATRCY